MRSKIKYHSSPVVLSSKGFSDYRILFSDNLKNFINLRKLFHVFVHYRAIVFGGLDGLMTTLAIISGAAGLMLLHFCSTCLLILYLKI